MMKGKFRLAVIAALAVLALTHAASAFYSPAMGWFLNRDPINEPGAVLVRAVARQGTRFVPRDLPSTATERHLYAFVHNEPQDYVDPLGLAASKPKTQCKLNGQPVTMTFDGQAFSGSGQSWPAASGRPIKEDRSERYRRFVSADNIFGEELHWFVDVTYVFDYSKERQKLNSEGPAKEGKYWIDAAATNCAKNARRHRWWHWAKSGWGDYSWAMNPYPETDMSGRDGPRSNFFIHGGDYWGSAGCIDLLHNDVSFNDNIIEKVVSDPGESRCYIDILVKYTVQKTTMFQSIDLGLSY